MTRKFDIAPNPPCGIGSNIGGLSVVLRVGCLAVAATIAFPVFAQAACPVAADLEQGILIEVSDGETEQHFAFSNGRTRVVWTDAGEVYTDILAPSGLSLAYWIGSGPTGEYGTHRLFDDDAIKTEPEVGQVTTFQTVEMSDGAVSRRLKIDVEWTGMQSVLLGDCPFDLLLGTVEELDVDEEAPWVVTWAYIPELGTFSLLGAGVKGESQDVSTITAIKAIE